MGSEEGIIHTTLATHGSGRNERDKSSKCFFLMLTRMGLDIYESYVSVLFSFVIPLSSNI